MSRASVMRTRATLTILSPTRSVDEIVRAIALEPAWTAERGSQVAGASGNIRKYTAVAFQSGLASDATPSEHTEALLERLDAAKSQIRALAGATLPPESRAVPVNFSLNIESSDAMVGFELSAEQLAAIAQLGAHFGVEVAVDEEFARE